MPIRRLFAKVFSSTPTRFRSRAFDTTRLDFPSINVDVVGRELDVLAHAERDAAEEHPSTEAEGLGGAEQRILTHVLGDINTNEARVSTALLGFRRRIDEVDLQRRLTDLGRLPNKLQDNLRELSTDTVTNLLPKRNELLKANQELEDLKSRYNLSRDPRYPESRLLHWAFLFLFVLIETGVNAYFFAQGSDQGLVGGLMVAFFLALVDIVFIFNFGRLIPGVLAPMPWWRLAGIAATVMSVVWILGYNLLVAHVREQLQLDPTAGVEAAWKSFQANPFGLHDLQSWLLFVLGLAFSVGALFDGIKWDDSFPRYGDLHRRARDLGESYRVLHRRVLDRGRSLRDQVLKEKEKQLRSAKNDQLALGNAVDVKETMIVNFRRYVTECESACNALLGIYRSANEKSRKTPCPSYFSEPFRFEPPTVLEEERERLEQDQVRMTEQKELLGQIADHEEEVEAQVREVFDLFRAQIQSELAPPSPTGPAQDDQGEMREADRA